MLATVLPSAATMPMASTNSGNAMIVSIDARPTMRSVQPPKKPAQAPASAADREGQATAAERDAEIEPRGHHDAAQDVAAELVGAEPVARATGGLSACAVSLASGSYGASHGPTRRRTPTKPTKSSEGAAG